MAKDKDSEEILSVPSSLIAKYPCRPRDSSKLLQVNSNKQVYDKVIKDIPTLVGKDDLVIYNDCLVIKARLSATRVNKSNQEKKVFEIFLLSKKNDLSFEALIKPLRRLRIGDVLSLGSYSNVILTDIKNGHATILFDIKAGYNFAEVIDLYGSVPIPPYLERESTIKDEVDYQTIFAKTAGAVAAPTAGLHFSKQLYNELLQKGVKFFPVTLLVSGGTFIQPTTQQYKDGVLHSEKYFIPKETWLAVQEALQKKQTIVAIGTTSLRALESTVNKSFAPDTWCSTNLFIRNNYPFKIVDTLMTNFHLPKSTLLDLVKAFIGKKLTNLVYKHAIDNSYRFYSYGDACWFEKQIHNDT